MNLKYLVLFIFICILIFGSTNCKKDKSNKQIQGVVKDAITMKPIPNANVLLLKYNTKIYWGNSYYVVTDTISDNEGHFNFDLKKNESQYAVTAVSQHYLTLYNYVTIKENIDAMILLQPSAYLNLNLKDTTPTDTIDWIQVYYSLGSTPLHVGINGKLTSDTTFMIFFDNSTNKSFLPGNSTVKINWEVWKNSFYYTKEANVFCPTLDTTIYEIRY